MSSISGHRLEKHGLFICDLVLNILNMYKDAKSVLLIAHSMGGVAARIAVLSKYCV